MKPISLYGVFHSPEMDAAASRVMHSGRIAFGEHIRAFEEEFGRLIGQDHVVSTSDMTSAMVLGLHLAGVRPGDEVLTTSFACLSTNSAIVRCGATPVWVDVRPDSVEMDVDHARRLIGPRTKAAIVYHVAGYPGPVRDASELCRSAGISLIEDCNACLKAEADGVGVGHFGDFAVFSFYPTRLINATEGGALVCKSGEHAARARQLRRFGIDPSTFRDAAGEISADSDVPEIGWSCTLNNLCAAVARTQVEGVVGRLATVRRNAATLAELLGGITSIRSVNVRPGAHPDYWGFLVLSDARDELMRRMKTRGVQVSGLHHRNDTYSGFNTGHGELPNTRRLQQTLFALPCGWWLAQDDLAHIADVLEDSEPPS